MQAAMTCRERVMAALNRQEPDRVPSAMRGLEPLNHLWWDSFERAIMLRDRFGIDDFLYVGHDWTYDPQVVTETTRRSTWGDAQRPVLVTEEPWPGNIIWAGDTHRHDYSVGVTMSATAPRAGSLTPRRSAAGTWTSRARKSARTWTMPCSSRCRMGRTASPPGPSGCGRTTRRTSAG